MNNNAVADGHGDCEAAQAFNLRFEQTGPMLRTEQIALVQQSWSRVQPIAEVAAALSYKRLFELDPAVRCKLRLEQPCKSLQLDQTLTRAT